MSNSNSNKQVLLSVIGVAILVVAVVGVSFAFFNYTRTGTVNTVKTGQIFFEQSQSSISLTNVFPVSSSDVAAVPGNDPEHPVSKPGIGYIDVTIHGYTTYSNGVDFAVYATGVNASSSVGSNDVTVPFSVDVSTSGFTASTATVSTTSYGPGQTHPVLTEGAELAHGNIKAGGSDNNNFTGHIYVKAYLNIDEIAITDTYDPDSTQEVGGNTVHVPTDQNGTTSTWVDGRTVLTTQQWNSLADHPLSFKIKVVANEGAGA